MDTAIAQAPSTAAAPSVTANVFTLKSRRISVTFSAASITGQPLMHFQDRQHEVSVRGDEIRRVETEIGTLVTITLEMTVDTGALLFTLVVPRVALASPRAEQRIFTQGFYTRTRLPLLAIGSVQLQTSEVVELKGDASFVES